MIIELEKLVQAHLTKYLTINATVITATLPLRFSLVRGLSFFILALLKCTSTTSKYQSSVLFIC